MLKKPILNIGHRFTPENKMELLIVIEKTDVSDIMKSKKPLEVIVDQIKNKPSKEANAYLWVLCDKIAKKINSTKEEVYKSAIYDVGVFKDLPILEEAVEDWIEKWKNIGLGWFAENTRTSKLDGYAVVRSYYGSSVYNTKEMYRLLVYIVNEAQGQDIDTRTPREIEEMAQKWGEEK